MKNQMIRTAESIGDNIVEGCGAATNPEFARFLDIAIKAATELEGQLERGRRYRIIDQATWHQHQAEVIEIRKMAHSLRKKVLRSGGADG